MKTEWTKETILDLKGWERPTVRAITHDGRKVDARFAIDGNSPWLEYFDSEHGWHAERYSWGLVLLVMNDPYESPIGFSEKPQTYTVPKMS